MKQFGHIFFFVEHFQVITHHVLDIIYPIFFIKSRMHQLHHSQKPVIVPYIDLKTFMTSVKQHKKKLVGQLGRSMTWKNLTLLF